MIAAVHGILASMQRPPPAGGDPVVTVLDSKTNTSDQSSYSFSAVNFGTAGATRKIVVVIGANCPAGNTNLSVTSVTIGGVAAAEAAVSKGLSVSGLSSHIVTHWIASVPTGTSGTIVVNFNGTCFRCGIVVYALTDSASMPTTTRAKVSLVTNDNTAMDLSVNVSATAVVIGATYIIATAEWSTPMTWVGLTKNYDISPEGLASRFSSAAVKSSAAASPRTITVQPSGSQASLRNGLVAVWD